MLHQLENIIQEFFHSKATEIRAEFEKVTGELEVEVKALEARIEAIEAKTNTPPSA